MMLAAGLGTRLWPLTARRGKPAVPWLGTSFVRRLLDWLDAHGATEVIVNTHHRPGSIRDALAHPPEGMRVRFSHEDTILGTAGALGQARAAGLLAPDRTTLVINAKLVTDLDLGAALATHRASRATVTMLLRTNHHREAFTTVRVRDGRVTGFGPSRVPEGPRPLLFTGLHFLEPEVLARAEARFSDTVRDLYPPEITAGRVAAHVDDGGRWLEASTLARYLELHIEAARGGHPLPADAQLEGAQVEASVLGAQVRVDRGARVRDSVLLDGVRVGAGATLDGVVVTEGVDVPPGARLRDVVVTAPELVASPPEENAPEVSQDGALALARIEGRRPSA